MKPARPSPFVARFEIVRNSAGMFDVALDGRAPFSLAPGLAILLAVLADDRDHRLDDTDRLVGFKTTQVLVHSVGGRLQRMVTRRLLASWLHRLRTELNRRFPNGGALIQTRKGGGHRLALLRTGRTGLPHGRPAIGSNQRARSDDWMTRSMAS